MSFKTLKALLSACVRRVCVTVRRSPCMYPGSVYKEQECFDETCLKLPDQA